MGYVISSWCATCGKAKSYTALADTIDMRTSGNTGNTQLELCTCTNTVSVLPVNDPAYAPFSPAYYHARLTPDQMQELEAMIRHVVAEELAKVFQDITRFVFHEEGETE